MATIYKRTRLQPIPTGAAIVERGGKLFAEWTNRKTKRRQRAPLNDDGTRVAIESAGYEIEYVDHNGERKRKSTRCPDKDAAQQLANEIERNVMLRKEGIVNPADDRYSAEGRRSIKTHLEEFKAALAGRANTLQHCEETFTKSTRIVELCAAAYIHDLTASAVQAAVGKLKDDGKSLKTCNHYLRAIKSFSRWLRGDKRSREDALATLKAFNAATDPKHVRREITPEETSRLLATTEKRSREEHNMSGPDRVMVYRLALGTGFRVSELRSLAPSSFDLDSDPPTVTVAAAHSKRRRTDAQPIRRDLAEVVRVWLGDKAEGELLFAKLPQDTAKMLRRDLKAARAEWIAEGPNDAEKKRREKTDFLTYEDSAGGIVDFHALRHAYISSIVNGGASVKVAQELARHSTPTLTIGRYAHTRLHDLRGALDSLPSNAGGDGASNKQPLRATGTDDRSLPTERETTYDARTGQQIGGWNGGEKGPNVAKEGETLKSPKAETGKRNLLAINKLGSRGRTLASLDLSTPTGMRTECKFLGKHVGFAFGRRRIRRTLRRIGSSRSRVRQFAGSLAYVASSNQDSDRSDGSRIEVTRVPVLPEIESSLRP